MNSIYLTEEHIFLQKMVKEFSKNEVKPLAAEIDSTSQFPTETIKKMSKLGLMGIPWQEKYGGAGLDTIALVVAIEEIAQIKSTHLELMVTLQ